jgi:hypothetical protein
MAIAAVFAGLPAGENARSLSIIEFPENPF